MQSGAAWIHPYSASWMFPTDIIRRNMHVCIQQYFLPYLYIVWKIIDDRLTRETEFILRATALPFYTCECLTVRLEPWNTLTQSSHPLCVFCQQTCSKQGITSSFECNVRMQKRFLPIHFIYRHTNS